MMKKFLLIVCGSFVGTTIALIVFMLTSIVMSIAIMSLGSQMGKASSSVQKSSILYLNLKGEIAERDGGGEVSMLDMVQGNNTSSIGLNTLLASIDKAKTDKKIEGIYIECNGSAAAPATRFALRRALKDFKQSGKWIYAYGNEGIDQGDYYLASVADSIFINPVGAVDVHGMASAVPYFKKLLDKVGVEMQVIRVGTFKSAVEPYMLEDMSEANRLQTEHYMGSIWHNMRDSMAADRKIDVAKFDQMTDSMLVTLNPDSLVKCKVVDALCYPNEMEARLKTLTKLDKDEDLRLVDPADYAPDVEETVSGDHIAVLYAVGEIVQTSDEGPMGGTDGIVGEKMVKQIKDLQDDEHVKGLVLRVNSPGGSAFASEQIWKALEDFKASGKPLAVSMGDYAASGGYYISSGAQRVFAEPTTITGSIGIFGMIPCYEELAENKLGVHMATVKTNENADFGIMTKRMTPSQRNAMQQMVNRGYDLFTKRCAQGRHVTQDSIKHIAEGRVWDGMTALKIGLVDELGSLESAIKWVAQKANMKKDYKTQNYPAPSTDWRAMLNQMMAQQYELKLQGQMGMLYNWHKELQRMGKRDHILCLMPETLIY
ncbi:MAG: signal peptide peptidase SppA [Muribaculaceae bacterium]|nr:signal peptide peptidase SppA [Muribaculaceae bacterium]